MMRPFAPKKKYGAAERAMDPQFEESRERFNGMVNGVGAIHTTLTHVRGDHFTGLSEPVASVRNFYQDQPQTAETCSKTMRSFDDALVAYNVCSLKQNIFPCFLIFFLFL